MDYTFATTEFEGYKAGDVVRMNDFTPFGDAVILGFDAAHAIAKVARPYAYASLTGTTAANHLLGAEVFSIAVDHIRKHWKKVDSGRTT